MVRARLRRFRSASVPDRRQSTAVDDRERFAQRLRGLHLVGREDDRPTLVAELDERFPQEREVDRVEPGERLVHEQHVRSMEDRGDELDLLLVALAEFLGPAVRVVGDPEPGQPVDRVGTGAIGRMPVQRGEVHELVGDRHARIQAALLGQVAERLTWQVGGRRAVPA